VSPVQEINTPEGWTSSTLGAAARLIKDKIHPADVPADFPYVGLEHVQAHSMQLVGHGQASDVRSTKTRFGAGDVLYGKLRPYLNKVTRPDFSGICSTDFLVFGESQDLDCGYLAYFLNQLWVANQAHHLSSGVELPRVDWKSLGQLPIVYPKSKDAQRTVVSLLDRAVSLRKSSGSHLELSRRAIERLRRAIVTAACSGRVTENWRTGKEVETAEAWLRRTGSYELYAKDLPSGWAYTTIGSIAQCLDNKRVPVNKDERLTRQGAIPYYGANGQVGWIDDYLFDEDLVLVVEDETFTGRQKPFSYIIRGKSWVNNHAHVLRPIRGMTVEYLNILLSYYDFIPLTSGTTGRRKLTKSSLMRAPIAVAPPSEQSAIVERTASLLARAESVQERIDSVRLRTDRVSQAILSKAFRGEFLPNEPTPAGASQ
jgi:type I restriction enzyme S subunit